MKENAWTTYSEKDLEMLEALMNGYKAFLTTSKTERECAYCGYGVTERLCEP